MQQALGETADDGPEAWHYRSGMIGALQADGLLPAELFETLADPEACTFGYRVIEEIVRPDLSLHIFAVPGSRDGRVIMRSPFRDIPAISAAEPVPDGLARGRRKATRWAAVIGAGRPGLLRRVGPAAAHAAGLTPGSAQQQARGELEVVAHVVG